MSKRLDYNQIAPAGVKALGGVYGYVMQSGLSPALVELDLPDQQLRLLPRHAHARPAQEG
jgi:hypothetical protein